MNDFRNLPELLSGVNFIEITKSVKLHDATAPKRSAGGLVLRTRSGDSTGSGFDRVPSGLPLSRFPAPPTGAVADYYDEVNTTIEKELRS